MYPCCGAIGGSAEPSCGTRPLALFPKETCPVSSVCGARGSGRPAKALKSRASSMKTARQCPLGTHVSSEGIAVHSSAASHRNRRSRRSTPHFQSLDRGPTTGTAMPVFCSGGSCTWCQRSPACPSQCTQGTMWQRSGSDIAQAPTGKERSPNCEMSSGEEEYSPACSSMRTTRHEVSLGGVWGVFVETSRFAASRCLMLIVDTVDLL